MTALAGLWSRAGIDTGPLVRRMLDGQAMYGPEPAALRTSGEVTLGRRLYPMLVEDDLDRGPVAGGDGTFLLVADARIDNRDELGERLGLGPSALMRLAEPELLMAVVERLGVERLGDVIGAWALALWDARANTLVLARDTMGERPLHYHRGDGFVAFASMPRGLHALPDVPNAPNRAATADFLAVLPEGEESFFTGVARVPPGHAVRIDADGIAKLHLWTPSAAPLRLKPREYAEGLAEQLDRATVARLRRAGGGVGTHLSAGLDSASVTATAARLTTPDVVHAFTSVPGTRTPGPTGSIADEGPLARATARMYPNVDHVLIRGSGASPLALLDRHFDLYQRPVMNPCNAVWHEAINQAAKARGVRVLLTGQCGNLTISYDGMQRLPELLRRGQLMALARLLFQLRRHGRTIKGMGAATLGPFLSPAAWTWLTERFGQSLALASYSALRNDDASAREIIRRATSRGGDLSQRPWANGRKMRLWSLGRVDMGVYNKGTLAGWGLDMRDPTGDRRLIEWALRVPDEQYILDGEPRSLARRAFADRLPADVLAETRRGYQAADWHVGVGTAKSEIAAELESLTRSPDAAALVDTERLRTLLDRWPAFAEDDPRWNDATAAGRHRPLLLRGLAAGHFLRRASRTN